MIGWALWAGFALAFALGGTAGAWLTRSVMLRSLDRILSEIAEDHERNPRRTP